MDIFSLLIGVAATIVTLLLGLVTLGARSRRWVLALVNEALSSPEVTAMFKMVVTEVLMETGLIRYSRFGEDIEWPNGWENLPDALQGIDDKIRKHLIDHP